MTAAKIIMTDQAAQQIGHLVSLENSSTPLRLRISVNGGGCAGFQYHFCLNDAKTPDDQIFEKNGVEIIIDEISLSLLSDSVIDYTQDLTSSQFVVKNPNATAGCGCGNSFSV